MSAEEWNEHNAAVDMFEGAKAKVIEMFGESFEVDRVRDLWEYCDLETKERRAYETSESHSRLAARYNNLRSVVSKIFTCEKCHRKATEGLAEKCPCEGHAGLFVALFFQMEGKMYREKHALEMQAITTDPLDAAKKLALSERLSIATHERQKQDKSRSRRDVSSNATKKSKEKPRKLQAFAIKLYREKVRDGKDWNDSKAAKNLDSEICRYSTELVLSVAEKQDSRIAKYKKWFSGRKLQAKHRRTVRPAVHKKTIHPAS